MRPFCRFVCFPRTKDSSYSIFPLYFCLTVCEFGFFLSYPPSLSIFATFFVRLLVHCFSQCSSFLFALFVASPSRPSAQGHKQLGQLVGSDVPRLVDSLRGLSAAADEAAATTVVQQHLDLPVETEEQLQQRIASLVRQQPVMLFMKGKRDAPFCRFSKAILQLLQEQGIQNFGTFDVLEDPAVRASAAAATLATSVFSAFTLATAVLALVDVAGTDAVLAVARGTLRCGCFCCLLPLLLLVACLAA